ncbi:LaeA-like protein [Delphinella strobiligena]|nr:LaeA-like protein [Delphinella strobiligena]
MGRDEWYEENGRLYHSWQRGLYMYPLDEQEQERMDIYHNLLYRIAGLPLHGPRLRPAIPNKPRIMDVGCGTGHWAVSIADDYPEAEVLGLDLANIQPAQIPRNVQFQVPTNIEGHWTFGQDSWDLIHASALLGSVSSWPIMYHKIFSHLRPGYGYIQHIEIDYRPRCDDGTMREDGWLSRWYNYLVQASEQANKPIEYRENTRELLRDSGFVDIAEHVIQAPLCSWNNDPMHFNIANYHQLCLDSCFGLEALSYALFSRLWGWDLTAIRGLTEAARTEIRTKAVHEYNNIHVWTARRPAH